MNVFFGTRRASPIQMRVLCGLATFFGLLLLSGCGETQIGRANRGLVESIVTAVSAKNPEWVAANEAILREKRNSGAITEAEGRAFEAILEPARAGDWAEAERLAFRLRDGQRATSEDTKTAGKPRLRAPEQYRNAPKLPGRSAGGH